MTKNLKTLNDFEFKKLWMEENGNSKTFYWNKRNKIYIVCCTLFNRFHLFPFMSYFVTPLRISWIFAKWNSFFFWSCGVSADQALTTFKLDCQLQKYVCLSNGLSSAPIIFPNILKPIFSALHKKGQHIMGYMGDSFLLGDNLIER